MIILFEDEFYPAEQLQKILPEDMLSLSNDGNMAKTTYVGYFCSKEPTFILPKVFIDSCKRTFGKENLSKSELADRKMLNQLLGEHQAQIVSRLSFWLYQGIDKYSKKHPGTCIVKTENIQDVKSVGDYSCTTLVEVIQSLRKFNRDHEELFTFIVNANRSGVHNINWNKTISKVQPLLQKGEPIYMEFINKKKYINFDEEIIVLFYSVLEFLKERYFFDDSVNINFNLLPTYKIEEMMADCMGTIYLNKIRHKYFTDDLVKLWNLLYIFFEKAEKIENNNYIEERVLAYSFNNIFEDMIDQLIGSSDSYFRKLKHNKDGKIIDHLYEDESLINNGSVYFIGDSKYYKESSDLGENSVYKQFTYAKNIIQYNLNIFQKEGLNSKFKPAMRDELTEGYNILPNFFIRASAIGDNGIYDYEEDHLENEFDDDRNGTYIDEESKEKKLNKLVNYHFSNRLFDRDTLVLQTYNINFLYVLAKYVEGEDDVAKARIHKTFREDLIRRFDKLYSFYKLTPRVENADLESLVDTHFRILNGRVICPSREKKYLYLALEKTDVTKHKELHLKYSLVKKAMRDFKHEKFILCELNNISPEET